MTKSWCLILGFLPFHLALAFPLIPDPSLTPGHLCDVSDADYSTNRYSEGIPYCERSVSGAEKEKIYQAYHIPKHCHDRYTIDHFIPLSLGGSNALNNLWPEHKLIKGSRADLEVSVFQALYAGRITQVEAIRKVIEEKTNETEILRRLTKLSDRDCDQF